MLTAGRVAVLSDVHGNAVALEAVLREVDGERPDLLVYGGDVTWGSLPAATAALIRSRPEPVILVQGNAESALLAGAAASQNGDTSGLSAREAWMLEAHHPALRDFLAAFVAGAVVDIGGLGPVRFCHGSPRSDREAITFATPASRMRELTQGIDEPVLVSAHTHLQFDRSIVGVRSINAGSVGLAYGQRPGVACWGLLGPDVELRRTEYDVEEAARRYRATDDPGAGRTLELMFSPPEAEEIVAYAEQHVFAD